MSAPEAPSTGSQSERPRFQLFPLVVSWLATGIAFMVAAGSSSPATHEGARNSPISCQRYDEFGHART
jgi:hypothetical protein